MADGSAESIQQKISIARRDAEALKDRIKKKKDELADTTRMFLHACPSVHLAIPANLPPQSAMSHANAPRRSLACR